MTPKEQKRISKRLSLVLRHAPESIGLELDGAGWAEVERLLTGLRTNGLVVTPRKLQTVVEENPKRRFEFDESGARIRARQGHSVAIDLGYTAIEPPEHLFHGTATRFLDPILQVGLLKMSRQHVHLSTSAETMMEVAKRHGKPVLLEVAAAEMHRAGHEFFLTGNDVWLTDRVPPEFLREV